MGKTYLFVLKWAFVTFIAMSTISLLHQISIHTETSENRKYITGKVKRIHHLVLDNTLMIIDTVVVIELKKGEILLFDQVLFEGYFLKGQQVEIRYQPEGQLGRTNIFISVRFLEDSLNLK